MAFCIVRVYFFGCEAECIASAISCVIGIESEFELFRSRLDVWDTYTRWLL